MSRPLWTLLLLVASVCSAKGAPRVQAVPRENWSQGWNPPDQATQPVTYHGGPLMSSGTRVYYIWYGNWSTDPTAKPILDDFASNLGGSLYFSQMSVYSDNKGRPVSAELALAGETEDHYSEGKTLRDEWSWNLAEDWDYLTDPFAGYTMVEIVKKAIDSGLRADPDGIYVILPSGDVTPPPAIDAACGWHHHATIKGVEIKYAFVANPRSTQNCYLPGPASANGDLVADSMANILAHELAETVTDPLHNGYFDASGNEVGDKCAWDFGDGGQGLVRRGDNGAAYNVTLGQRNFLLQQLWVNDGQGGGFCSLGLANNAMAAGERYLPRPF